MKETAGGRILKIVWDERKRIKNLQDRGLDFAELEIRFFESSLITGAKLDRFKATGSFNGRLVSVIFKPLGLEAISVISMRAASRKERASL